LASASEDKTIKLWNFEFQNEMTTLQGQSSEVNAISFSSDGKHLVSGSNDGTLQLWCV
jgi:WD40 repeat protein